MDAVTAVNSSPPLPSRPRHVQTPSIGRKRNNEEVYEPPQSPLRSPKTPKFPKDTGISISQHVEGHQNRDNPFQTGGNLDHDQLRGIAQTTTEDHSQREPIAQNPTNTPTEANRLVGRIEQYQKGLEEEFQEFEQSLSERDKAADLESLDWNELEKRYNDEIQPKIATEEAIMNEFQTRFQQFLLYMQVSNEHEAERAVKRLRTRIAIAQNAESSLATKQAHHSKVLQAFQNAMELLGNL